jgi:hypothetical protein
MILIPIRKKIRHSASISEKIVFKVYKNIKTMETNISEIPVIQKNRIVPVDKKETSSSCCTPKNNAAVCCDPSDSKDDNGVCCLQPEDGSVCCDK